MKNKVEIDDFLILIFWVQIFYVVEKRDFIHQHLLDQAITYKFNNTPFDITIHYIDDLMIDAYKVYEKLKQTEVEFNQILDSQTFSFMKDSMIGETNKFQNIFENLMENCKFEDAEIRGIQKGVLAEKVMKKYVAVEDYENAAKVRDLINSI